MNQPAAAAGAAAAAPVAGGGGCGGGGGAATAAAAGPVAAGGGCDGGCAGGNSGDASAVASSAASRSVPNPDQTRDTPSSCCMDVSTSVVLSIGKLWSTFIVLYNCFKSDMLILASLTRDRHIRLLEVVAHRRRWVGRSAAFDPCAARGGAVALAGRNGRLSVPPSFPRSVRARAFYAVLELPAAVLACGRGGLDLGVLPPDTIFARPYRFPASGFGRNSSVGKPSLDRCFRNLECAKPPSCTP